MIIMIEKQSRVWGVMGVCGGVCVCVSGACVVSVWVGRGFHGWGLSVWVYRWCACPAVTSDER